jgi:hypothetical protein
MRTDNNIKKILISSPFIIGIFIIICAGILITYFQKQAQCQDLQLQIDRHQAILQNPSANLETLEDKLSNIEAQLTDIQATFPKTKQSIEIVDDLLDVAQMTDVEVISLSQAPSIENQSNVIGNTIMPISLEVQGTKSRTLTYISHIAGSPELLETIEIKGVNIWHIDSSEDQYIAELQLYIYAQSEDSLASERSD